ncbi:MAG: PilZ domain-containing protein [Deltaproteobacteria bacterium]|nr:PilZ domain-containing protein [Deltaproteobacteria bacterium]MBW2360894.1 PilZ domain-containing protein [Deltaproteobacteria bacterium]
MASSPEVLLLDDGELDEVQSILDSLGVSYGRVRGAAIAGKTPAPRKLLVTTPRRIDAVPFVGSDCDAIVRIVVVSEDSPTLRAQLRDVGFDYLVRHPVHPIALRLLLLRCLFSGSERREDERVPVGFEVSYRMGLLPKRAVLADLSTRGCRILSKWAAEPGKRISLTIPPRAGVAEPLTLRGKVVRLTLDEHMAPAGPYSAAVEFEPLSDTAKTKLKWVLEERARGPAQLGAEARKPQPELDPPETSAEDLTRDMDVEIDVQLTPEPEDAEAAELTEAAVSEELTSAADADTREEPTSAADADADPAGGERRGGPRALYKRRIPAFGERAMRVLVARDLSIGGMRIDHESGLAIGDRLHLAIYGAADEEPFLVWASVDRDDGDRGLLLAFDPIPPAIAQQLEQVVVNLPAVESLHNEDAHSMGSVVSEILLG